LTSSREAVAALTARQSWQHCWTSDSEENPKICAEARLIGNNSNCS